MLGFDALAKLALAGSKPADDGAIEANASLTQASNTVASSGTVAIQGNDPPFLITENNSLSSTGRVDIRGNANLTQTDQLGADGKVYIFGTASNTQAGNTVSASATNAVRGNTSQTQDGNTVSANATNAVRGNASNTQAGNTISATVRVDVRGNASNTQASQTLASSATAGVRGTASNTQAENTIVASATNEVRGNASRTQDGQSVSATATARVTGTASNTQADNAVSATARADVRGTASNTQASQTVSANATAQIRGNASLTQTDQLGADGKVYIFGTASNAQNSQTISANARVDVRAGLNIVQDDNGFRMPEPVQVFAPSFSSWSKTRDKKKPKAPVLPDPVQRSELVVDEAVLQQMELERLSALVLKKKQEALEKVEAARATAWKSGVRTETRSLARQEVEQPVEQRNDRITVPLGERLPDSPAAPARALMQLGERAVTVAPATAGERRKLISLMAEQRDPPARETIPNRRVQRALGARNLPKPEMRLTKSISLRRDDAIRLNHYGT